MEYKVGDYSLIKELGFGAFGIVYRGRKDGEDYAVKVFTRHNGQ